MSSAGEAALVRLYTAAVGDTLDKLRSQSFHQKVEEEEEEEEECCLFDHHHGSGGYIKTQYKSLTCRPPKYIQFSYVAKK